MSNKKEFHLISKEVLEWYTPINLSKPLIRNDWGEFIEVYIAEVDFPTMEEKYNQLEREFPDEYHGWSKEITLANVSCEDFALADVKEEGGLFEWFETNYGATMEKNVCALIGQVSQEQRKTPIDLFNEVWRYINKSH